MRWIVLGLAIAATPAAAIDYRQIDIPAPYRGTWALDPSLCNQKQLGPAFVQISARRMSFYEETGYLTLARLNEVSDPPEITGRFSFVRQLTFFDEPVRMKLTAGHLTITRNANDDADDSPARWTRCSPDEGSD